MDRGRRRGRGLGRNNVPCVVDSSQFAKATGQREADVQPGTSSTTRRNLRKQGGEGPYNESETSAFRSTGSSEDEVCL